MIVASSIYNIENEQETRRTINAMLEDYQEKIAEKDKALNEQELLELKAQGDQK
jgi:hypothetical protein